MIQFLRKYLGITESIERGKNTLLDAIQWLDDLGELEAMKEEKVQALESKLIEEYTEEGIYYFDINWDVLDDIDVFPCKVVREKKEVKRAFYVDGFVSFLGTKEERKEIKQLREELRRKYDLYASEEMYLTERERRKKAKETIKKAIREVMYMPFKPYEINKISLLQLQKHSYISGKSGSGKSEVLKLLFYRLAKESNEKKNRSLMLLDPHGDIAQECKNLHLFDNDRVVYIDFSELFRGEKMPILNPFEISEKDETSISKRCQELTEALTEIVGATDLSTQMEAILLPCISTLLRMEGATMKDLMLFMSDEQNSHLIAKGKKSPLSTHRDFFNYSFLKKTYSPTKNSIYTKLLFLLGHDVLDKFFNGKSTINIEAEIDKGKVLIFNLSKGVIGTKVSNVIGRLIVSITKSIALSRAEKKENRTPVFMFVDECHNYISPSIKEILKETRKYGLHLVLANQITSDFDTKIQKTLLSNTAVKIAGKNNHDTAQRLAKEIRTKTEDIIEIPEHQFFIKTDKMKQAKLLKPPTYLLDTKGRFYLTKEQQKKQKAYLLKYYYKKIECKDSSNGSENSTEQRQEGRQEQTPTQDKPKPRFDI